MVVLLNQVWLLFAQKSIIERETNVRKELHLNRMSTVWEDGGFIVSKKPSPKILLLPESF